MVTTIKINEIDDVRKLLNSIYCIITHMHDYPEYGFKDIKRFAEIAEEIEAQFNAQTNPVQKAISGPGHTHGELSNKNPPKQFIFGKSDD